MDNTGTSFRNKWEKNPDLAFSQTLTEGSDTFNWILGRNGFENPESFRKFLDSKKRILDAGCGNGRVTALMRTFSDPDSVEIVGIDLNASHVAEKNLEGEKNVSFFRKDLLEDLSDLGKFDFIYCQEVLHHTSDPAKSFSNLAKLLLPGGEIAIYVYRKKAPIREFTDEHVRSVISGLSYEEAMKACDQITMFGKALSETGVNVKIPDVEILGIKAGEYDLQRMIYHFFMKCFWNPTFNFHDNSVINYDWYHPQTASKHTMEEVCGWARNEGLEITRNFEDFYGITVRAVKTARS